MVVAFSVVLVLTSVLMLALVLYHLRGRERAWTQPSVSGPNPPPPANPWPVTNDPITVVRPPGYEWTALDDYQLNRLLRDSS